VKNVLAGSEQEPEWLVDEHARDGQGGVEDAENGDHADCPARSAAYAEQRQDGHAPDQVECIVARVTRRDAQHIQRE